MSNTFALVSCTKKTKEETLLFSSVYNLTKDASPYGVFDYVYFFEDNKEGLSKRYNQFIEHHGDDYDYIIFAHDDVYIDDGRVIEKLTEAHRTYDIVGVAGGVNPVIKEPTLWHIMCGGFGPNLRGFAGHYTNDNRVMVTTFGPTPDRVAIADGLFLSIKMSKVKEVNWRFNENYTFHLYDIASCLDANKKRMKIGVYPIMLFHASPGLRSLNDPTFLYNQSKFMKEYSKH